MIVESPSPVSGGLVVSMMLVSGGSGSSKLTYVFVSLLSLQAAVKMSNAIKIGGSIDVSGTNHTLTAGNGLITLSHALTVAGTITAVNVS